jgi:hypothetical protein
MNRTKTLVIALWAMFVGQIASAQKGSEDQLIQEATAYFEQGAYLKAFPLYSQLVSLYPNHAEYAFKFGACAIYGDADKTKAVRYLNSAINKSVNDPEVYYFLGKAYHLNYQFKDAITAYENYVRYAGDKAPRKAETLRQIETCIYGANLLSNIKDITVISKTETDKSNFFRYFNLEAIGGKILTVPDALKSKEDMKSSTPGVIHYPGNGTTIYFSSYGKNASTGKDIYKAQVLPDGTFSEPEKLKGGVNTKYDEDFCFMHSDGRTLYFASKGHNSMGGYDIFKSVIDPTTGEFGTAVNLDFAINTPDDDIFYIADSLNQRAYFASGRSSDLDHLNVYSVMVETTPLQVVYLKGMFVSEIDPEQHKVGIKILESNTQRGVCDGNSNNSGEYIVYVPKSGQYTFKVVTENSPTIHEVSVKIPSFDKPVALRQEMRLINEGGKERIIVNNYFEEPLNEDLSILAAEMLRKKSVLDVNASDTPTLSLTKTDVKKEDELRTFDQNMDNATIAAGFEGGSVSSILGEMKSELNVIQRFIQQSDTKRNNSLAYARKKQNETEKLLSEAEAIRKALPGQITTEAEIAQLRRMVELTQQAEATQLDAQAAFNTAQAISNFKESETKRAEALQVSIANIQQAEQARNYDGTVAALTAEKDRRTAIRSGVEGSPYEQMLAKTKSLENERAKMETALATLRETEKSKNRQVMRLKESIADPAVKQSEKTTMQNELATAESELSIIRRDLAKQLADFNKSEETINRSYAEANFFKKVNDDSTAGLADEDMVRLTPTERDMLGMSIAALDTRVSQLEVTDPQMLAMLGEQAGAERNAPEIVLASNETTETKAADIAAAEAEDSSSPVAMTGEAAELRNTLESRMAILETRATLAPAKAMLLRDALTESRDRIASLEAKLLDGQISAAERSSLENLKAYEIVLAQDLAAAQAAGPEVSSEDVREICKVVTPEYETTLSKIENEDLSEIERAQKRMEYKAGVMAQLNKRQLANTRALHNLNLDANNEASMTELERLTAEDVQIAAAMESLSAEANHVTALKVAFDIENKAIIEGDQIFSKKLQDQLVLGDQYLSALNAFETQQREAMAIAAPSDRESFEIELQAIAEQRQMVEAKQVAYRHDLELTASASDPVENELMTDSVADVIVDELDPLAAPVQDANANTLRVEESTVVATETTSSQSTEQTTAEVTTSTETITTTTTEATAVTPQVETGASSVTTSEPPTTGITATAEQTTTTETSANVTSADQTQETTPATEASAAATTTETANEEKKVETEAKEIKELFAPKSEVNSIFAYETKMFDELVDKHPKISARLNNREQIQQLNDEIFILEGEMEVTKSESALKKLDVKAEQLYLKRSMLEIENAGVVADMTREEYNQELSKANEMVGLNQDKLNERVQVRDEVAKLKRESEMNMEAAGKLREQARPIYDDIERADYYRQAYALEALAIDQQRQIQGICNNLEMLTQYTEPQLAMMKTGTVPAELRTANEAAKVDTASSTPANTALEQAMGENAAVAQQANPTSTNANNAASTQTSNAITGEEAKVNSADVSTITEQATQTTEATAVNEPVAAVEVKKEDSGTTYTTRAETADPTKSVVVEAVTEEVAQPAASTDAPIVEEVQPAAKAEAPVAAITPKAEQPEANAPAAAEGRAKASANAADYYYSMPSEVVADLFAKTARGVYSDARPIPIDMEMPKGVYYKVQIGAFRNDIPQNLYDQFAPISGERLNTGITRYTAGFFVQFEGAKEVKQQIRAMGYNDAFIVAYRDGKRIPLYEAAAITDGPELAASIKEAFDKAAVGSVAQNTGKSENTGVTNGLSNSAANATAVKTSAQNNSVTASPSQTASANNTNASQNSNLATTANAASQATTANGNGSATNASALQNADAKAINLDAEVAAELARKPATRSVEEIEAAAANPKNTGYYKANEPQVAPADQVEKIQGLFFTVQVGVYSKPVAAALLQNVDPLNSELTETNKIRYTSGQFNNLADAVIKRDAIRAQGIVDAFVTAYYNGKRITLSEADLLLKEKGTGILAK